MIPLADPGAAYRAYKPEIDAAIKRVLDSGWYILGNEVQAFEREFASYCGSSHGVGVANGTDAIKLGLQALGVGPGDEVITVSHTAVATVSAILDTGATPVLVDIEPDTMTMDPVACATAVTPNTKAIVPVHIYGHPADMDPIMETATTHGLKVLEDCAQAHGAKYKGRTVGSIGHAAAFSFYPTKNLGAFGDGGMVVTSDSEVDTQLRLLRQYGWAERYVSHIHGTNSRLDEMQAAILRVRLRHLDHETKTRQGIAEAYTEILKDDSFVIPPTVRPLNEHAYHLYVIRSAHREVHRAILEQHSISSGVHYPQPIHQQPGYAKNVRIPAKLVETEAAAGQILSLPLYAAMPAQQALAGLRRSAHDMAQHRAPTMGTPELRDSR